MWLLTVQQENDLEFKWP